MSISFADIRVGDRKVSVSRLGFGCARVFGGFEKRHSARMLERAYEIGVRHFDTAPSYGHGNSENVIGEVFAGVTDITIMTKVGIARPSGLPSTAQIARRLILRRLLTHAPEIKRRLLVHRAVAPAIAAPLRIMPRAEIERALEESLSRLRRDRVDFYCVHEPDQFILDDTMLDVFNRLKAVGRIGAHGLAWGREIAEPPAGWDVIQSRFAFGKGRAGSRRFFHGVLRSTGPDRVAQLASAMGQNPGAVFIVSASEPHQLSSLARVICTLGEQHN